jgi:ATP-dependent Lhr-like helicase
MTESSSFTLLDRQIQHFIWTEGWEELHDAQEASIPLILKGNQDVIIAAPTAAGKTEAAFLPAISYLLKKQPHGVILYMSPLKALINDQFQRLERLCQLLDLSIWAWHGDISATVKARFLSKRQGILLITPESVEALLCNRGTSIGATFGELTFFIIDELHAFIGTERGKQLQSLMHRIENVIGRPAPRIGLSATLGDMSLATEFLRPTKGDAVALIQSNSKTTQFKISLKGYEEPVMANEETDEGHPDPITPVKISSTIFSGLRGSNNLVFPNSRRAVELYTHLLNKLCEEHKVPNEFWPHHGSLSKEIRSETEFALKQREQPATAICTNTLELGIDIGAVKSVAQIGPPPSVASLRQRMGRSGRRKGEPAILRAFCVEMALGGKPSLSTELRLETLQMAAIIELLLEGWFEPPKAQGKHYSTLVQQILSFISQNGGSSIGQLYYLLCDSTAPFSGVSKTEFIDLIRHLGRLDLLIQDSQGTLLHGRLGEKLINHYTFYAAFAAEEEFRIVSEGRALGTLPVSQSLMIEQRILFAGKTWIVKAIEETQKTIIVERTKGGSPPLFSGGTGRVHTRIRQKMRELLESTKNLIYLDETARRFLIEASDAYQRRSLSSVYLIDQGNETVLMTWLGDAANEALACLLNSHGFKSFAGGPAIEVHKGLRTNQDILAALSQIATQPQPPLEELLSNTKNLHREKWDWALPDHLLRVSYASLNLDFEEAVEWANKVSSLRLEK